MSDEELKAELETWRTARRAAARNAKQKDLT